MVLQEHTWKTKGKYLELFGTYDPHAKKLDVNRERIEHWMSQGAQISPTVNNLMVNNGVWDRAKMESWKPKVKESSEEGTDERKGEAVPPEAEASEEPAAEPGQEEAGDGTSEEPATT